MKTLTIPHSNISSLFKRTTGTDVPQHTNAAATGQAYQKYVVSAGEYIINALGEGFKQNFLGADINMEFLTLTLRSYATSTAKALRKLVVKPAAKQHHINPTSI